MYLTKKQLADLFQISTRTIDRLRAEGMDLGATAIGASIRFDQMKAIAQITKTTGARRRRMEQIATLACVSKDGNNIQRT